MKIGDLARETGVNIRLLRYYEAQGLLTSHRTSGGHRHYTADAPATVTQIRTLLAAGLPTRVIRDLMPCFIGDGPTLDACVQDHLRTQLHDLDNRITDLQHARASLGDLLHASARASRPTAPSPA
ncbi:MerR family transcriptional regulator [Streptomyces cocklensis]|jgi:DNA-binding transcriptional MerR regulator|uniref:DNA-binding transcriptional MerR regulator n=1 Tax=Actinacidiphila cocklensis TaxID=887465 RepID=A0A9W4GTN8_9ACTN|nr:MerR family transcriptional regulator [Actinacidiphila cocklensis]MDD1062959.1 MerR family transcriptional regulator [Actinacidiphila cocklensis]CAG6394847.1 DNA-binding transcriptional MerR regulator [Actinacidiphila cocklensis]